MGELTARAILLVPCTLLTVGSARAQSAPCFDLAAELGVTPWDSELRAAPFLFQHRSLLGLSLTWPADELQRTMWHLRDAGFRDPPGLGDWLMPVGVEAVPGPTTAMTGHAPCGGGTSPYIVVEPSVFDDEARDSILAHEYFHAIQQGYAFEELWSQDGPNEWILEATATFAEHSLRDLPGRRWQQGQRWFRQPWRSLTTSDASGVQYGTFTFLETLPAGWHGDFWDAIDGRQGWDAVEELDAVSSGFEEAWLTFLEAVVEAEPGTPTSIPDEGVWLGAVQGEPRPEVVAERLGILVVRVDPGDGFRLHLTDGTRWCIAARADGEVPSRWSGCVDGPLRLRLGADYPLATILLAPMSEPGDLPYLVADTVFGGFEVETGCGCASGGRTRGAALIPLTVLAAAARRRRRAVYTPSPRCAA